MAQGGRPVHANTIASIPEGPLPTAKAKWAAIAKWHAINDERKSSGFEEIAVKDFIKRTHISEQDIFNAPIHREYIEAAMSIAKGESTMWFRGELKFLREAAERLRASGDGDKDYVKLVMEIASMLKFKDVNLDGLEDSEAKSTKEVIEETMMLLNDEAVKNAWQTQEDIVAQKIIPSLINANAKFGTKNKVITPSQLDNAVKTNIEERPDKPMDSVSETGTGIIQS